MLGIKKRTAKQLFASEAREWVEGARSKAKQLLRTRKCVNIEDILEVYPFPEYLNPNIRGQVFKHPDFVHYSFTNSKRPVSRGSLLHNWRLKK